MGTVRPLEELELPIEQHLRRGETTQGSGQRGSRNYVRSISIYVLVANCRNSGEKVAMSGGYYMAIGW
jgi:hypothetical protein